MAELSDSVHLEIQRLCGEGDELAKGKHYSEALARYWAAWELLPDPKTEWDAATWLLAAIADANFLCGDFKAGRDNLNVAMHCPDAIGNPFLHLRLGQCQFELGDLDHAANELTRAFMAEGEQLFQMEDPKYLAFLKTRLQPPPSHMSGSKSKKPWWKFW